MCDEEYINELIYISAGLILLRHSIESGDMPTNTIVEALDAQRTHIDRIVSDWEIFESADWKGMQKAVSSNLNEAATPIRTASKAAESIGNRSGSAAAGSAGNKPEQLQQDQPGADQPGTDRDQLVGFLLMEVETKNEQIRRLQEIIKAEQSLLRNRLIE